MKKRLLSLVLLFAMTLTLAFPALLSRPAAAGGVYFTAVNDTLCPLNDATMPFWSGGNLYVPSAVFSSYDLGLSYARDTKAQTAALYSRKRVLEFDLAKGGANNKLETYYSASALLRGGTVYFPLAFVCSYFELTYSIIENDLAPMVRVKSDTVILMDSRFLDAAHSLMASRYQNYEAGKKPPKKPEQPDDPPPLPGTPPAEKEPGEERETARVYLGVRAAPETAPSMLDTLDMYGYTATFFFAPGSMEGQEDLLRRILATGHRVGLIAETEDEASQGNALLRRSTGTATRILLAAPGTLKEEGYVTYQPAMLEETMGNTADARARRLLSKIESRHGGRVTVLFGGGTADAAALRTVCRQFYEDHDTVHAAHEVLCTA